ncbi:hypothetical protein HAX54_012967, partial [Datura stramonium]|nr:hypothetical protein [Datura stramonium]
PVQNVPWKVLLFQLWSNFKLLSFTRSVTIWTSPPGSLRTHEDVSTSLGRRGTRNKLRCFSSTLLFLRARSACAR